MPVAPSPDPTRQRPAAAWHRLGSWPGRRVALVSAAWALLLTALTMARAVRAAQAYQRADPDADTFLIGVGMVGGFPALLGPPLALLLAWLWARRRQRSAG